ncbi:hypothetical protein P5673_019060 [Acropora cervicornis]|uniref:Uncharacterized protein n=1 Tax=Acropora cervicornis TaxID=6130 RepID=A0AAD9QBR3_ACRCE|nr:hypothetical protein P5673_019060 [Acropora cervicornis]
MNSKLVLLLMAIFCFTTSEAYFMGSGLSGKRALKEIQLSRRNRVEWCRSAIQFCESTRQDEKKTNSKPRQEEHLINY